MKKVIFFITILLLSFCSKKEVDINYNSLIKKHISDPGIQKMFKQFGKDYKNVNAYGMHYYGYDKLGIKLNFSDTDTLRTIYFSKDNEAIPLPYGLKMYYTRERIEELLGKAESYRTGATDFVAYYPEKNLIVRYKNRDSLGLNNPVRKILITNVDLEHINNTQTDESL
ncbi:MAG: hypothetical protein KDC56_11895 [Flavobacteriaceae bacterium]|nr:hypothetical protein [Flavobacteriaceae bacterium]